MPQSGERYRFRTLHPGQVLSGSKFCCQVPPRQQRRQGS